jgi:hypothetical protein
MSNAEDEERAMSDLYETDVLLWSERQAELLRRRAAGELVNDAELDWPNIAEEIESVGSEQRHAVESLLLRALIHMLKAACWPLAGAVPHWQAEARVFRAQARRRFVPSMRQRIDLAGIYADAMRGLPDTVDGLAPLPISSEMPTLDDLLVDD